MTFRVPASSGDDGQDTLKSLRDGEDFLGMTNAGADTPFSSCVSSNSGPHSSTNMMGIF